MKDRKRRFRLQIPALISEKFKSKKVKYANELTDDVTLTQYYTKFLNRAILANLQCRPLKHGRLIVLHETHKRL